MRALVIAALLIVAALAGFGGWWMYWPHHMQGVQAGAVPAPTSSGRQPLVQVTVPTLSVSAEIGEKLFNANCASCHGLNAAGSDQGPPLVHRIYEPSHHGDAAFYRAALQGVQAHHWRFGNMPPVEGVAQQDVTKIIEYVRELQRANGIL